MEEIALDVDVDEVCAATPSARLKPYASQYEGYMGNYGNTVDRWYRRAAVVVWPRELGFANRAEASPTWAVEELVHLAHAADPAVARETAATMEPFWGGAVRAERRAALLLAEALPAAVAVDDPRVASILLRPFPIECVGTRHAVPLAGVVGRYGGPWADELLTSWFHEPWGPTDPDAPSRQQWLTSLPALVDALLDEGRPGASAATTTVALAWEWMEGRFAAGAASSSARERRSLDDLGEPLVAVVGSAVAAGATDVVERVVGAFRHHGDAGFGCLMRALRAAAASPGEMRRYGVFSRLAAVQRGRL
jgi:hypothetical protein